MLMVVVSAGDNRWLSVVIAEINPRRLKMTTINLMDGIHLDIKVMRFADRIHIPKWADRRWRLFLHLRQPGVVFNAEDPLGQE